MNGYHSICSVRSNVAPDTELCRLNVLNVEIHIHWFFSK